MGQQQSTSSSFSEVDETDGNAAADSTAVSPLSPSSSAQRRRLQNNVVSVARVGDIEPQPRGRRSQSLQQQQQRKKRRAASREQSASFSGNSGDAFAGASSSSLSMEENRSDSADEHDNQDATAREQSLAQQNRRRRRSQQDQDLGTSLVGRGRRCRHQSEGSIGSTSATSNPRSTQSSNITNINNTSSASLGLEDVNVQEGEDPSMQSLPSSSLAASSATPSRRQMRRRNVSSRLKTLGCIASPRNNSNHKPTSSVSSSSSIDASFSTTSQSQPPRQQQEQQQGRRQKLVLSPERKLQQGTPPQEVEWVPPSGEILTEGQHHSNGPTHLSEPATLFAKNRTEKSPISNSQVEQAETKDSQVSETSSTPQSVDVADRKQQEENDEPPDLIPMIDHDESMPLQTMVEEDSADEQEEEDDEDMGDEQQELPDLPSARNRPSVQPRQEQRQRGTAVTTITMEGRGPSFRSNTHQYTNTNRFTPSAATSPNRSGGFSSSPVVGGHVNNSSRQVVFPAAPISPAHLVLVRGTNNHQQSASNNSAANLNSGSNHSSSSSSQRRLQRPQNSGSQTNVLSSASAGRNTAQPAVRSTPSPGAPGNRTDTNTNSLGELLSRNNPNSGSHHSNNGGTNESVATGSNRSTDTAATTAVANHAQSNSSQGTEREKAEPTANGDHPGSRNNADPLRPHADSASSINSTNNENQNASSTQPSSPDASSSTPSTPRLLRPALTTQHSLRTVVHLNDPAYQTSSQQYQYHGRRLSVSSNFSYDYDDDTSHQGQNETEFFPRISRNNEWMGRSVESLVLGHVWAAPMLALEDQHGGDDGSSTGYGAFRRRSTASTFGGVGRRRSSQGSFPGGRRSSLSLTGNGHGGTLANYFSHRRRQQYQIGSADYVDRSYNERIGRRGSATATGPMSRRRSSMATTTSASERSDGDTYTSASNNNHHHRNNNNSVGPNVVFSLLARETTGKPSFARGTTASRSLRAMGGAPLFTMFDKPAAGMATEVAFLAAAIDIGDWAETQQIISRLTPRLTGDPMNLATFGANGGSSEQGSSHTGRGNGRTIEDASLPPTAPKFYAGGGRLGLERDAFFLAGGVQTMIRIFREKSFVGQEMSLSYDARDLSEEIVTKRLASAWNEALVTLRDLVYAMPFLVEDGTVLDNGDFLPFLFTLLAHDSCFEAAAALIEEILSLLSQAPQQASQQQQEAEMDTTAPSSSIPAYRAVGRVIPAVTFYLGNVPDLYRLWRGFNCRQLAHFCRIMALLVFEPEDRLSALSENATSTCVLKSIELLQLRRNRSIRAGRDSTVDMNQAILLGDRELLARLLKLLRISNFAPSILRFSPYHVMTHNPFIVDTLFMLGFTEFENWGEIDRQELLARQLLFRPSSSDDDDEGDSESDDRPLVSQLGSIADWLENLSDMLNEEREPANQLLRIMTTAQQAGLVVGSRQSQRSRRGNEGSRRPARSTDPRNGSSNVLSDETNQPDTQPSFPLVVDGTSMEGLASFAGMLTDQVLVRRLYQNVSSASGGDTGELPDYLINSGRLHEASELHHPIQTPSDAANNLQFNAMMLGPYQVEILFVLCTFLGGKRKLDAQDQSKELGLVSILEEMFERLPWFQNHTNRDEGRGRGNTGNPETADGRSNGDSSSVDQQNQPNSSGIHGPGCECTPESTLCVQYLRLLHNFCDRDCDNYEGRQLLLSPDERRLIFAGGNHDDDDESNRGECKPGLLWKIIQAFINESDESPYRFWLASCIESYLRGSSAEEQIFMAKSGLLQHLVRDVSSERLHCSGSLQTSFDLLGELGKGNADVFRLLVSELDEQAFRKLMGVAAANLVDSNVFIRSLLLSLERLSVANYLRPLYINQDSESEESTALFDWNSARGSHSRSYLTHTWWDTHSISLDDAEEASEIDRGEENENADFGRPFRDDEDRQSDWFPSLDAVRHNRFGGYRIHRNPVGLEESIGHNGWLFAPAMRDFFSPRTVLPNSIERVSWFLAANQGRLLRDLLDVVDLRNINHENICCLNTAVVIAIFAHRRQQLVALLQELRQGENEDNERRLESIRRNATPHMPYHQGRSPYSRNLLRLHHHNHTNGEHLVEDQHQQLSSPRYLPDGGGGVGETHDILRNFREVLWFWREYYTHRGRDRLSLEYSSHLRFQEWDYVVSLLGADDGSALSLVPGPIRLPRSPYQRTPLGLAEYALLRGL